MEAVNTWPEGSLEVVRSTSMWPRQGFSSLYDCLSVAEIMVVKAKRTYVRTNSIPWVSRNSVDPAGGLSAGLFEDGSRAMEIGIKTFGK